MNQTAQNAAADTTGAPKQIPRKERDTAPFGVFERMLAVRYLRSKKSETMVSVIAFLSLLGIMIGTAALIIVMAVMNGFRDELRTRILGTNGHLILQPLGSELTDYDVVAKRAEGVTGVNLALPLIEGQVLISGDGPGTGSFALVRGMRENDVKRIALVADNITAGTLDNFDDPEEVGIAVGDGIASQFGLSIGSRLTLISPQGNITPLGVTPRVKSYPIKAIFKLGMSQYDNAFIFMPFGESQLYFNSEDKATVIELFVDDPDDMDELITRVTNSVERQIYVADWRTRDQNLFNALEVERNVMFMILTLIVVVAALNIISSLIMLVKDKGRDIAILRTMGANRAAIMRIFMMTGSAIGVVGTLLGVALGILVTLNIRAIQNFFNYITGTDVWDPTVRFLSEIPAKMDPYETAAVIVMALVLSFLATLFPSWRASQLDPIEALRYE